MKLSTLLLASATGMIATGLAVWSVVEPASPRAAAASTTPASAPAGGLPAPVGGPPLGGWAKLPCIPKGSQSRELSHCMAVDASGSNSMPPGERQGKGACEDAESAQNLSSNKS